MNVNKLAKKFEKLKNTTRQHSFIYINDNSYVDVEYCHSIIKFENELIILQLAKSIVKIIGFNLSMKNYGYRNVKIYGKIYSIQFEEDKAEENV